MATWVKRKIGYPTWRNRRSCTYVVEEKDAVNYKGESYKLQIRCKSQALYYLHHRYWNEGLPHWLCAEHYRWYKPIKDGEIIDLMRKRANVQTV